MYIIRKYIKANSAAEALAKEKEVDADDVWVDDDWKKENQNMTNAVGFIVEDDKEDEDGKD